MRKAMEIYLLSERFSADEAKQMGLVNRVVSVDALKATVDAWATSIATGPAVALRNVKRLVRESLDRSLAEQLRAESDGFAACAGTSDFAEGLNAFFDKRSPRFSS